MDNPQDNDVTAESANDTPDVEASGLDDDDFLAGIDTDSEINLSLLPDRTSPPPAKPLPPAKPAPSNPQQSSYRGLLLLTILLVLIPVLGGFALWQMNNSKMQAEINRLEATINAQAAAIDAQVATRVAAAIEQVETNAPNEVPVEVVEVMVTATTLPATNTPVPLDTPTNEPTDSPAADLELPTATPSPPATHENSSNNTPESINVSNVAAAENPASVPVGQTVYFQDNFDSNTTGWFTGQRTHPHARNISEIVNGSYRRSVVSAQEDVFKESSPIFTARNFVLGADATFRESSNQTGLGLTFREDTNGNTYLATFNANGTAELLLFNNSRWQSIASQPGIELVPGETNNFAIAATGPNFTLYINGQPLLTATDDTLSGAGKVGVAVITAAPNQTVVVDFDNLLVTGTP